MAFAVLCGLLTGWWMPRGPVTTVQALTAIGVGLVVGGVAGLAMRTRWAMLPAPAVFVAAFELARISTAGPLVDGIHLGSPLGVVAFVLGRGLTGVLVVVPMLLGVTFGAAAARRLQGGPSPRQGWGTAASWARRGGTALVTVGLVLLSLAILRPASTASIRDADGRPVAGSIAELTRVDIGGHDLSFAGGGGGFAIAPSTLASLVVVVGGLSTRPRAVGDHVEIRDVLDLTVTIDHNVVDGAPATRFGADLRRLMHTGAVLEPVGGRQ